MASHAFNGSHLYDTFCRLCLSQTAVLKLVVWVPGMGMTSTCTLLAKVLEAQDRAFISVVASSEFGIENTNPNLTERVWCQVKLLNTRGKRSEAIKNVMRSERRRKRSSVVKRMHFPLQSQASIASHKRQLRRQEPRVFSSYLHLHKPNTKHLTS